MLDSNSLVPKFIIDLDNKTVKIKDEFDYAGESIALADVVAISTLTHTSTATLFHQNTDYNTPDINHDVSLESTSWNLPTDVDGAILAGKYTFLFSVRRSFDVAKNGQQVVDATTIKLIGEFPELLEAGDSVVISGSSVGNNGSYTVVSAVANAGNTDITISEGGLSAEGSGFIGNIEYDEEYTATFSPCLEFVKPTGAMTSLHNCDTYKISGADATDYDGSPSIVYANIVNYPVVASGTQPDDFLYTLAAFSLGPPIYTGTFVIEQNATATYTLADTLVVVTTIRTVHEHTVTCDESMCNLADCFNQLLDEHEQKTKCGVISGYENLILLINGKMVNHRNYVQCGELDKATELAEEILVLIGETGIVVTSTPVGTILQPSSVYYLTTADKVSIETPIPNLAADNSQDAFAELQGDIDNISVGGGNLLLAEERGTFDTVNPAIYNIPADTLGDGDCVEIWIFFQSADAASTLSLNCDSADRATQTTAVSKGAARITATRDGADASDCDLIVTIDTPTGFYTTETIANQDLTAIYPIQLKGTGSAYKIISPRYMLNKKSA